MRVAEQARFIPTRSPRATLPNATLRNVLKLTAALPPTLQKFPSDQVLNPLLQLSRLRREMSGQLMDDLHIQRQQENSAPCAKTTPGAKYYKY